MYGAVKQPGGRARTIGLVSAAVLTFGAYYGFSTGLVQHFVPMIEKKMEVFILTPEKPIEIKPVEKPKEIKIDVPAPDLVAPPELPVIPVDPVIIAPPAPAEPVVAAPSPITAPATPDSRPRLMTRDKPDYPSASIRAQEQGTTRLDVCVSAQGRVQSVQVTGSSGFARLDEAAAKWLRSAKFSPAIAGGSPTAMCGHPVVYQWDLKDVR